MLRQLAANVRNARPRLAFRGAAGVGLWASSSTYEYVFGQTANGGKTVSAIDVAANGCDVNVGIKVDHDSNLWVACQADPTFQHGLVQEYTNGTLAGTYAEGCPSPSCSQWYSYGFDVAADSFNHVFAGLTYFQMTEGSTTTVSSGFEWWSSPSGVPALIALPTNDPVTTVYFFDVDSIGNIWFDYEGCTHDVRFRLGGDRVADDVADLHAGAGTGDDRLSRRRVRKQRRDRAQRHRPRVAHDLAVQTSLDAERNAL